MSKTERRVYLVDVQACFQALKQTGYEPSFPEAMASLRVEHEGWCAGNDAR